MLYQIANTTKRAANLLFSHPKLIATVKKTVAGVEKNDKNKACLAWARNLLDRFPDKVQHARHQAPAQ